MAVTGGKVWIPTADNLSSQRPGGFAGFKAYMLDHKTRGGALLHTAGYVALLLWVRSLVADRRAGFDSHVNEIYAGNGILTTEMMERADGYGTGFIGFVSAILVFAGLFFLYTFFLVFAHDDWRRAILTSFTRGAVFFTCVVSIAVSVGWSVVTIGGGEQYPVLAKIQDQWVQDKYGYEWVTTFTSSNDDEIKVGVEGESSRAVKAMTLEDGSWLLYENDADLQKQLADHGK